MALEALNNCKNLVELASFVKHSHVDLGCCGLKRFASRDQIGSFALHDLIDRLGKLYHKTTTKTQEDYILTKDLIERIRTLDDDATQTLVTYPCLLRIIPFIVNFFDTLFHGNEKTLFGIELSNAESGVQYNPGCTDFSSEVAEDSLITRRAKELRAGDTENFRNEISIEIVNSPYLLNLISNIGANPILMESAHSPHPMRTDVIEIRFRHPQGDSTIPNEPSILKDLIQPVRLGHIIMGEADHSAERILRRAASLIDGFMIFVSQEDPKIHGFRIIPRLPASH